MVPLQDDAPGLLAELKKQGLLQQMQQLHSIEAGKDEPAAAPGEAARNRELYEEMHKILESACGPHSSRWGHLQGRGLPGGLTLQD